MGPMPDAVKPGAILEIVTPFSFLHVPSTKHGLFGVSVDEVPLSIIAKMESASKHIFEPSDDTALSNALFNSCVRKRIVNLNSSDH